MKPTSASLDDLKHQLAKLDSLIAEGVLKGTAAQTARDALERQIVEAVTGQSPAAASDVGPASTVPARPSRSLALAIGAFVVVFAVAGYAWLGNREGLRVGPGEPGGAAADAAPHAIDGAQLDAMIARLVDHLKQQPDDADGWAMLARSYTVQGRYTDALPAYKRAVELRPQDAQILADYADGLAVVNNKSLEGEPEKLVMQAIKLDPKNVKALSLAGTIAFGHEDFKSAVDYWQRAVDASDPSADFTQQLRIALDEARKRAGMPPLAPASVATPTAPPTGTQSAAAANAVVAGRVTLKSDIRAKVSPDDTVFIFARAPGGSRMPLAILRKKVSDLPLDFTLDDSLSMSPAARLSSAQQVVVGARISRTGNAMPQPGDWQALSAPVAVGDRNLHLEIGDPVR